MIQSKQQRCARFVWAYVTQFGPMLSGDIPSGATYSREEIGKALTELEAQGYVAWGREGYYATIPFVLDAPAWAVKV